MLAATGVFRSSEFGEHWPPMNANEHRSKHGQNKNDLSYLRSVAVGTSLTERPPHRSVRAHSSAYGSYLGCLASNRTPGSGCRIRGRGR
jgi:hypothetical protein